MSRLTLRLSVFFFRTLQSIFTCLDLYLSYPLPQRVSFTRKISSTACTIPGSFKLLFYTPLSYRKIPFANESPASTTSARIHPLLINFHGGSFTIGNAGDDARWATAVTLQKSAVVASVGYRLAPEYPFPIGIEDCTAAVLWLWKHAGDYNLDITKTAISGFSAGGNLVYAVSIRLREELSQLKKESPGEYDQIKTGKVLSLVVFYGSTDWTQSRAERDASNPNRLQLFAEIKRFRVRLVGLGKNVDECVVEGVGHAWDKKATYKRGEVKRDEAYTMAVKSLQKVWA